jgi:hypothetical protein
MYFVGIPAFHMSTFSKRLIALTTISFVEDCILTMESDSHSYDDSDWNIDTISY